MDENNSAVRSPIKKVCFVCLKSTAPIINFKEETLTKCSYSLAVRVTCELKDQDKILPTEIPANLIGYHSTCYRSFNAIGKKYKNVYEKSKASSENTPDPEAVASTSEGPPVARSSQEQSPGCSFEQTPSPAISDDEAAAEDDGDDTDTQSDTAEPCIFCTKQYKRHKRRKIVVSTTTNYPSLNATKEYATKIDDVTLLTKMHDKITNCQPIAYHRLCKVLYRRRAETLLNNKKTEWHKNRGMHAKAFQKLCIFISDNVVTQKKCYLMTFMRQLFANLLIDEFKGTGVNNVDIFDTYHIQKKIFAQRMFRSKIRRIMCGSRLLLAPHTVSVINNLHEIQSESVLQTAALQIRSQILKIEQRKLSHEITAEDLTRGECEIPKSLIEFFQTILSGCNYRRKKNPKTELRANSIASDLIYATTAGKIMPSKHITLGITLKSLTSSKKVLSLINKLGHCISYNVVEELETEASYTSVGRSELCPTNVHLRGDLHTGVAFDNFDRFVETIDGKDTLHDTVGIIYQDVCEDVEQQNRAPADDTGRTRKRRRTFDTIIPDIQPFSKRLKSIGGLLPVDFSSRSDIPSNFEEIKMIDAAWLISHVKNITTPMWVGFNAKIMNDSSTKQIISYLPTINASPTDVAVVVETMKRAIKIADECNQTYIQVTYDLAIAKMALQVQSMQKDEFARLFIHLGPFHIQMSFLKAVGTFISSCGLTTVMVDSGLLAAGSVGGFLSAKNFNRAKRLHVLVSLALNMEHFKFFMASEDIEIDESVTTYLRNLQSHGLTDGVIDNAELREIIVKYQCFKEKTLTGQHGKTAQYYMMYTNLIDHFLMLSRSIRTGDFSLFKYILPKMNNLLFPLNHVNYARWLLRYHDNLIKVEDTHPGLSEDLAAGYFGIKRTDKNFSRQPIDLVTEQTINADAGRTLTGISHFTNSIQARLRWTVNYAIRSGVCSFLLDQVGLSSKPDITNDLNANRIRKSQAQVTNFINGLNLRVNPFDTGLQESLLYNISTGESAPPEVADFLLSIDRTGDVMRKEFIESCADDENKFSTAVVKRSKIQNFDTTIKKRKIQIGDKVKEIKVQKDLFGRLVAISMKEKVDIAKVLTYPLTPVPLCMCHIDGSIHKTDKAVLTKALERTVDNHAEPGAIDVIVYDGFAIFHTMKQVPTTFGNIALKYLSIVCSNSAKRIDVIFDEYRQPSIKETEHVLRDSFSNDFTINGSEQIRPSNLRKELRNDKFKTALVNFIIQHWTSDAAAEIIGTKVVLVNFDQCYKYVAKHGHVTRTIEDDLSCPGHEEADTKIIYHLCHIESPSDVVIRCSDTDVLVIMLANICNLLSQLRIWMDFGTGNTRRLININKIHDALGDKMCRALPGLHALTGCDYTPCFYRKGKKRSLEILQKSDMYQDAFLKIFEKREESFTELEAFVCRLYNQRKIDEVNEVRFHLFMKSYSMAHTGQDFMKNVKNFDASLLPPCKVELRQQLLRVLYISTIWCNAHLKYPSALSPEECGWKLVDPDHYDFHWFDGDAMPGTISEIVMSTTNDEEEEDEKEKDEEEKDEDEDTDAVSSDEDEENEFEDVEDSGSDHV